MHGRHVIDANDHFSLFLCESCDALFIGGVVADAAFYETYYGSGYYDAAPPSGLAWAGVAATWLARQSLAAKMRLCRRVSRALTARIRLLDVGCGAGDFLASLDCERFDALGLEISKDGREKCQRRGLKVLGGDVADMDFGDRQFDVVTMWHVLEHLPEPGNAIRAIRRWLSDSGTVLIAVPNHRSLGFRLGGAEWFHLDSPRHLFIPSRRTIERLAHDAGFQVEQCFHERWDYPLDLWWSVRRSAWRSGIWPLYPLWKVLSRESQVFVLRRC
jgi:SAM-dependent methyltransferase